jgi:hypothetical protein
MVQIHSEPVVWLLGAVKLDDAKDDASLAAKIEPAAAIHETQPIPITANVGARQQSILHQPTVRQPKWLG